MGQKMHTQCKNGIFKIQNMRVDGFDGALKCVHYESATNLLVMSNQSAIYYLQPRAVHFQKSLYSFVDLGNAFQ